MVTATADGLYGEGLGSIAIAAFRGSYTQTIRLMEGLCLCYLGIATLWANLANEAAKVSSRRL